MKKVHTIFGWICFASLAWMALIYFTKSELTREQYQIMLNTWIIAIPLFWGSGMIYTRLKWPDKSEHEGA